MMRGPVSDLITDRLARAKTPEPAGKPRQPEPDLPPVVVAWPVEVTAMVMGLVMLAFTLLIWWW